MTSDIRFYFVTSWCVRVLCHPKVTLTHSSSLIAEFFFQLLCEVVIAVTVLFFSKICSQEKKLSPRLPGHTRGEFPQLNEMTGALNGKKMPQQADWNAQSMQD